MRYNVFYLSEWEIGEPVYYFVDQVEATNSNKVFDHHLVDLAKKVRDWVEISEDDLSDDRVAQQLYLVREEDWIAPRQAYRSSRVADV